jgi:hypothetical protein
MMDAEFHHLRPYYRNGLLYFPEKTIGILLSVGLDWRVGYAAKRGLAVDDEASLNELGRAIRVLLRQAENSSALHDALAAPDVQFMLTGRPIAAF